MSVTAADLTAPTGELQSTWFTDLSGNLAIWLSQGEAWIPEGATQAQADAVVTAYGYVRGFRDVLLRAAKDPNSISLDKGDISLSFTDGQRKVLEAQVTRWEAAYDAAIDTGATATVENVPRASQSVTFQSVF